MFFTWFLFISLGFGAYMENREGVWRFLAYVYLSESRAFFSNKEIAEIVGLPEPVISRYVSGGMLPNIESARQIISKLRKFRVLDRILDRVLMVEDGIVNISRVALDASIIKIASIEAFHQFSSENIDVVLTAAVNGVPLATLVSGFLGCKLSIAKHVADADVKNYIEVKYLQSHPPRFVSLYLPSWSIPKGARVLIVDDLLFTGNTLGALREIVDKAGGHVVGVFALIGVGDLWRRKAPEDAKVIVLKEVEGEIR